MKLALSTSRAGALALLLAACGGEASQPDAVPTESTEDALTRRLLSGVVAVELEVEAAANQSPSTSTNETHTIGEPTKLSKVLRALKERRANDPIAQCHRGSPRTTFKFFDKHGNVTANGSYACGSGTLDLQNGEIVQLTVQTSDIDEVVQAPLVPADALWGLTHVRVNVIAGPPPTPPQRIDVHHPLDIASIVDAMNPSQSIDTQASLAQCSSHAIMFYRGDTEVAYANPTCSAQLSQSHSSRFALRDTQNATGPVLVKGAIRINGSKIQSVYENPRPQP